MTAVLHMRGMTPCTRLQWLLYTWVWMFLWIDNVNPPPTKKKTTRHRHYCLSLLRSESIKYSQRYFFLEQRMGSFSIQSVSSLHKSLLHWTFLLKISAEIHLAVRKQLLFVKGSGGCNFNFKDVLNELPPCDWWAVRNLPPLPLYPSTEVFNYEPLVLMLSAPVWYASCMSGEWIFTTWLPTLYSIIAHNVNSWKCIVIKVEWYCLGDQRF